MKATLLNLATAFFIVASVQIRAQGFIYDQQSQSTPATIEQIDGFNLQEDSPLTQSFIPTLNSIGFIQLQFFDPQGNGNNGATVYVNLWAGSPNVNYATLLGSTSPVYMPNGFWTDDFFSSGVTNFYFSTPISLTVGTTYYFQPVVLSGDNPWEVVVLTNVYANGELFSHGAYLQPGSDFWFREGIVATPEPPALALAGLGSLLIYAFKRRSKLLAWFAILTLPLACVQAQVTAVSDSVVQVTADLAGLTPVAPA